MQGMRALDIGCSDGYFSFEMERRGADVVATDFVPETYTGFATARRILGSAVDYRMDNVYNLSPEAYGFFDVVLFMGVLYHLRHPLLALDLLHRHVTREVLVFQSMLRGSDRVLPLRRDYPFTDADVFEQPGYPVLHFVENRYAGDHGPIDAGDKRAILSSDVADADLVALSGHTSVADIDIAVPCG